VININLDLYTITKMTTEVIVAIVAVAKAQVVRGAQGVQVLSILSLELLPTEMEDRNLELHTTIAIAMYTVVDIRTTIHNFNHNSNHNIATPIITLHTVAALRLNKHNVDLNMGPPTKTHTIPALDLNRLISDLNLMAIVPSQTAATSKLVRELEVFKNPISLTLTLCHHLMKLL
jgi:hypothetical protein